jgi:hypothetical protein
MRKSLDPKETLRLYRAWYESATTAERLQGRAWYPAAESICHEIARKHDADWKRVARAMAALSPQTQWEENVKLTWAVLAGSRTGTFKQSIERAVDCLAGERDVLRGRKVRSFAAAILGNRRAACIDTWMLRAADHKIAFTKGRVLECQWALDALSRETGETVRDLQAIIWIAIRNADEVPF